MYIKGSDTKDLEYYIGLDYPIQLHKQRDDDEEYWIAEILDLPGCMSDGLTPDEALNSLDDAKLAWIESQLDHGHEVPEPSDVDSFSGRLLVRMPKSLHRRLSYEAKRDDSSLNQYIISLIAAGSSSKEQIDGLRATIKTLAAQVESANTLSKIAMKVLEYLELGTRLPEEQAVDTSVYGYRGTSLLGLQANLLRAGEQREIPIDLTDRWFPYTDVYPPKQGADLEIASEQGV